MKLMDEVEAARRLGLSRKTLQGWRWRGCGPAFHKLGAAVRYSETDIEDFLANRRRDREADRRDWAEGRGARR